MPEPVADALQEVWSSTAEACRALKPEEWELPTDCPGWTVRDQLSHTIGIERSLLGDHPPAPVEAPHVRNPIGAANEAWVAERRSRPGEEVLAELREVTGQRLTALRALGEDEWEKVGWSPIGQVPYRRFMWLRVMDSWVHEQDVRRALGRPGGRGGAGEAETLRHTASLMPYVVGKKARPPEGSIVAWELTGSLPDGQPARVAVEVRDGRGHLVGDAREASGGASPKGAVDETAATAVLRMDAETFWRLGCGRIAPGDAAAEVSGDPDLGQRVLEAMNFMI